MKETMENTWQKFQKELTSAEEYCADCDNGEDLPCVACIKEDTNKAWGIDSEETWANLPTTCPDFVSHPHIVNGRGCYTCQVAQASEEQGTTALMSALLDIKIPCDVHQTGGFTMCVYIKTGDESYIYANAEGFALYCDENCDGWSHYEFSESENTPQAKAKAIAQTMKMANLQAKELN
jgi:hypothetical protein